MGCHLVAGLTLTLVDGQPLLSPARKGFVKDHTGAGAEDPASCPSGGHNLVAEKDKGEARPADDRDTSHCTPAEVDCGRVGGSGSFASRTPIEQRTAPAQLVLLELLVPLVPPVALVQPSACTLLLLVAVAVAQEQGFC